MRILIAEDDRVSRRLLEVHLGKWGYHVVSASDGVEAWQILSSDAAPRIAILDWMMPGLDGTEICRRVRSEGKEPYTYLILLTALSGEANLCAGMDAGADDYLTKPLRLNELRVRLRAGRRIVDLQDELIAAREALRIKASHDPLTGLWNHEEVIDSLQRELVRVNRGGKPVGVIMADIDHFKQVNDRYGHMTGDAVLRAVAGRMLQRMRPYDTVGRYGGEEFMIVLPGCDGENAGALADRLRMNICSAPMHTPEGDIPITISLGVVVCSGGESDASVLIHAADRALYRAKEKGRNRVEVALLDTALNN
jgi:two-component system, cell cycle response regulator